jgi:hypothetical protein
MLVLCKGLRKLRISAEFENGRPKKYKSFGDYYFVGDLPG